MRILSVGIVRARDDSCNNATTKCGVLSARAVPRRSLLFGERGERSGRTGRSPRLLSCKALGRHTNEIAWRVRLERRFSENTGPYSVHRRVRGREGTLLRAADEGVLRQGSPLCGAVLRRPAVVRMGGFASRFRRRRHRYRSRSRGTPGRLLRHSVQVLRARHPDPEASPRFVHLCLGPRTVHRPHRRRYRRRLGTERAQDHRVAEARVFSAAFRRPRQPALRLARSGSQSTGRHLVPARAVQLASPSAGRVRRRDRRLRGP